MTSSDQSNGQARMAAQKRDRCAAAQTPPLSPAGSASACYRNGIDAPPPRLPRLRPSCCRHVACRALGRVAVV